MLPWCQDQKKKIVVKVGGSSDYVRYLLSKKYVSSNERFIDQMKRISGCGCEINVNGYVRKVIIRNPYDPILNCKERM
jgi:hypothetical protein